MTKELKKILVANRGEIARRVIQSIQEMGKVAVAIYSDIDKGLPYVKEADEAYHLPGIKPGETYLDTDKLIAAILFYEETLKALHEYDQFAN